MSIVPADVRRKLRPCCLPLAFALQMLERESSREKNLEKSAKEARAKARKEAARTAEPLDAVTEEELAQVGGHGGCSDKRAMC